MYGIANDFLYEILNSPQYKNSGIMSKLGEFEDMINAARENMGAKSEETDPDDPVLQKMKEIDELNEKISEEQRRRREEVARHNEKSWWDRRDELHEMYLKLVTKAQLAHKSDVTRELADLRNAQAIIERLDCIDDIDELNRLMGEKGTGAKKDMLAARLMLTLCGSGNRIKL